MTMNCCLQFHPLIGSFFSTETAVLKVVTDILAALDRGQISLLGMFDLSAAFDTVDHSILLRRLEISFGIRGAALEWFSSYLTGRSQQVSVHNVMAMSVFLDYGVPQGSVLGSVLFLLYTSGLVELVRSFGLLAHDYADDLQVYCHMNVGSEHIMLQRFRDYAHSVSQWMSSNRLKLSPSKRDWFGFTVVVGNLALLRMTLSFLAIALLQFTLLET